MERGETKWCSGSGGGSGGEASAQRAEKTPGEAPMKREDGFNLIHPVVTEEREVWREERSR